MNRRALLAALGAGATAVAGCLADDPAPAAPEETDSGGPGDDPDPAADATAYESCDRPIVGYGELPDDVAAEVDAALEDGSYETDGPLLYAQAIAADAALSIDDAYYAADIERDGETTTLRLAETTPTKRSPEELVLRNETDDPIDMSVIVARVESGDGADGDGDGATGGENGTVLLEEDGVEVDPRETHEDERRFPVTDEYGDYEITVELADGRRQTFDWRIEHVESNAVVTVETDEIEVGSETILEIVPCPWNES